MIVADLSVPPGETEQEWDLAWRRRAEARLHGLKSKPGKWGSGENRLYFLGSFRISFFLELLQLLERAEVGAVKGDVVAIEGVEASDRVVHCEEGADGGFFVEDFWILFGMAVDLIGEAGGLETPDAELTPASDGHLFDEGGFSLGLGVVFVDQGGELLVKALVGFAGDDDGLGEEAMTDCVAGRSGFAFFGDGTMRLCAIDPGGFDLSFGSHCGFIVYEERIQIGVPGGSWVWDVVGLRRVRWGLIFLDFV